MNKILTWFIRCWIAFALLVNVVVVVGIFHAAHSFSAGFSRFAEIYGPMNPFNWIAELVLVSPAIGAYAWLRRRQRREDAELIGKAEEVIRQAKARAAASQPPPPG